MKRILIVLLLLLSACSNQQADFSVSETIIDSENQEQTKIDNTQPKATNFYGELHVEASNVIDDSGNVVQLKGISTHGINWFPEYVNYELLEQINSQTEINTIRITMYTEDYNGYLNTDSSGQQQLLELIDQAVNYAISLDLYLIIDWHILSDGNPLDHTDEAKEFFELMSDKYGDIDNVIFEICNEPNGDTTWADIEQYANQVIPVIRENSDNLIIVGTPNWSQDVDSVNKLGYDNIVYSLHFYAATHKQNLIDKAQVAIDNDVPLFVSEFGISEASGDGQVDTLSADAWIKFLDENQISYVMWNLSNKDESSALIKNEITKTSELSKEDLTESGKWYLSHVTTKDNSTAEDNDENLSKVANNQDIEIIQNIETWENGGKYTFDIDNQTSERIASYQLKITFDKNVNVMDNWNGTAVSNGNVVVFTPKQYISSITSQKQVTNLGMIIECDGIASITSVEIV